MMIMNLKTQKLSPQEDSGSVSGPGGVRRALQPAHPAAERPQRAHEGEHEVQRQGERYPALAPL